VEKRTKLTPFTNSTTKPKDKPKARFMAVPSAFELRSAHLALAQQPAAPVASSTSPYLLQWLRSGKNLDFCLLAICSCILTLLCHHTSVLPSSSAPSASTAPIANFSSLDFTIKAGLFTRLTESDEPEVESAED
jgi:hypothetical protein